MAGAKELGIMNYLRPGPAPAASDVDEDAARAAVERMKVELRQQGATAAQVEALGEAGMHALAGNYATAQGRLVDYGFGRAFSDEFVADIKEEMSSSS